MSKISILFCSAMIAFAAFAQDVKPPELPFRLGDSIGAVRAATNGEIETTRNSDGVALRVIHQKRKGIWIFFNPKNVASSIRLDPPYPGYVAGVRLGDSAQALQVARGLPIRAWKYGDDTAYLYALDGNALVRYDVNPSGQVATIFILSE